MSVSSTKQKAVQSGPLSDVSPRSPALTAQQGRLTVAQYQSASAGAIQAEVQVVQDALCNCQAAYNKALADVNRSAAKIQQLQQHVKFLHDEDAALSGKVPLPVNRLCRVRQWLSEKAAALDAEQTALESKKMALLQAESKLRAQETEASLLDEAASTLNTAAAAAVAAAAREATVKHDREAAAASRQVKQLVAHKQHEQQYALEQQQAADARQRVAAQCQMDAKERLAASQRAIRAGEAAVAEAAAGTHAKHWESLLQLKAKVDEVRESVAKQAEKTRQLRKQKKEQQQREFEALQEQGLNPYQMYKERDADAAADHQTAQLAANQQHRKAEIAAALAAEDRAHRKRLAKQDFDKQVEEEYQSQMGITAQQQRTDAYMCSHTLTKQAILNPTSRMPVYPSEAVLVKPVGFGLGRSSPEAVKKVAAKHSKSPVDMMDCLLLPSKYRHGTSRDVGLEPLGRTTLKAADGDSDDAGADADTATDGPGDDEPDSEEARDVDSPTSPGVDFGYSASSSSSGPHLAQRRSQAKSKQLQVAKLSKFEAERLELAKQRHKLQIAQPKAAFGRVFAGDAFIADPPAVVFKDFVPGHTYKAAVQLINRSFTGSTIRLLEVPTEVMHVLELDMPPSGCLAPGAAATLKVTFKPQADEPLSAHIPLLADSGPLVLPFHALVRQALPSIEPCPAVSLDGKAGGVMLGASGHATVTISNAGVLAMLYSVKVLGPLAVTSEYDEPAGPPAPADASEADLAALQAKTWAAASLSVAGLRVVGIKGRVPGYSSSTFKVEFTPRVPGPVEVPVLVSFTAPDSKGLAIPPLQLMLQATGRELPVSTLTPVVDFKCVMFGQSYVATLLLANAGKSAMKVLVAARPELSEWVSFTPDFGFIQASDTLTVSVALKPTPDMTHKLAKYLLPQHQDVLEIPLHVNVPGQPLQLPVKVRLQATTSDLYLSPKTLDFGRVPLTEAAGVYISITNPSALPQSFSFSAKLPLGLKLSPNAGYGRVLPQETVRLLATFQPPIPGVHYFDMCCHTLAGRVFKLEGKCDGLQPDVTLSHNIIKFPATAREDSSSASLVIRNNSSDCSQLFEFGVPQGSCLQVTPRVGVLKPQASLRVQIDFSPPAAAAAAGALTATATPGQQAAGDSGSSNTAAATTSTTTTTTTTTQGSTQPPLPPQHQQQQLVTSGLAEAEPVPGSEGPRYNEWLLPCFVKQAPTNTHSSSSSSGWACILLCKPNFSSGGSSSGSGAGSNGGGADYVLHVSVATCASSPELQLASPELPRPAGKNYWVLDFGALPVGERTTRELLLQNTGGDVASLVAAPLDPLVGAFSLVNALRPVEPHGGQGRVLLAFSPPDCCEFQEMMTLRSCKSRVRVCLKGRGIAPTLAVSPASATAATGGLAFGDVLLSDPVCKELKLQVTNTCPFTISYNTRFIGPQPLIVQNSVSSSTAAGDAAGLSAPPALAAAGKATGASSAAGQATAAGAAAPAGAAAGRPAAAAAAPPPATDQQQQQSAGAPTAAADAATAQSPGVASGCFWCKPSGGVLQAGQSQEVTVILAPLGGQGSNGQGSLRGPYGPLSPYVADRLQILVPHQQQDVVVPLHGNVWPDGVFVSGAKYSNSSSSSRGGNISSCMRPSVVHVPAGAAAASEPGLVLQDPFAAILVAAATAAAATPAAASSAVTGGQGNKAKQVAAAAASAAQQQDKALIQPSQPKDLTWALAAAGYCDLTQGGVELPGPVSPGQISSATVEFGAIKSSTGGAAGELTVEELPAEAKEAGWSVDLVKVSVPAGERRPLTIRYTAPAESKLQGTALAALGQLQLPVQQSVRLSLVMKGGCQPAAGAAVAIAADGSRRMSLCCSCVLAPGPGDAGQAVPGSGNTAGATPAGLKK